MVDSWPSSDTGADKAFCICYIHWFYQERCNHSVWPPCKLWPYYRFPQCDRGSCEGFRCAYLPLLWDFWPWRNGEIQRICNGEREFYQACTCRRQWYDRRNDGYACILYNLWWDNGSLQWTETGRCWISHPCSRRHLRSPSVSERAWQTYCWPSSWLEHPWTEDFTRSLYLCEWTWDGSDQRYRYHGCT